MTEYKARRSKTRKPTHPGRVLHEVVDASGLTRTETARRLGISRQHLLDLLAERKPVSAAVAVKLGKLYGQGGGLWIRMQTAYDLWHAEREVDLSNIKTLEQP
jgi:addiction module HigA family antidote